MKISYAITVKDELTEIIRLLSFLLEVKRKEDEVVILWDDNGPKEVLDYLLSIPSSNNPIVINTSKFENDFAAWKNKLNDLCSGDYIIQLDSDELPNLNLIQSLPFILENNESDIIWIPRINTVEGIGLSHIQKWGWKVSKLENIKNEKILDLSNPKDLDEYNLLKQNGLIIEEKIISFE